MVTHSAAIAASIILPALTAAIEQAILMTSSSSAQDGRASQAPAHTNRLIHETSPYLLQHAHNPVDWRPWSDDAFAKAREEDRLIFLSVGYSTCYWCHVMERESFEDEETGRLMNDLFINIKVDREERPDVDDIYMTALQLVSGGRGAGWPMSVWIEPQTLKPVYAGSYFPDEPRYGRPSFTQVCEAVADAWRNRRDDVMRSANEIASAVEARLAAPQPVAPLDPAMARRGVEILLANHDSEFGGFGGAPKFPQPSYLFLLLEACEWFADDSGPLPRDEAMVARIDDAVARTLDRMATGGIYDQIGGGFHRYSTDATWLVPHFEKMLYDNGQLASVYAMASERYHDSFYREIVRETLEYVLREMTDPHTGAFYSAQDAEVNAREGQNYLWTADQVREALEAAGEDALIDFALRAYGLDRGTNFQDPHHPDEPPSNVLFLSAAPRTAAEDVGLSLDDFNRKIERVNSVLLDVRRTRDQPGTDDKILTAWNGLMIAGMADGGRVLCEPGYIDAAARAAEFILKDMRADDGGLLRTSRNGTAKIDAFLEDYANMAAACLALRRATGDSRWLDAAIELADQAESRFADERGGGYFDTLEGRGDLFVRTKSTYDGALPGGNSIMLRVLMDLHAITGNDMYLDRAETSLRFFSSLIAQAPVGSASAVSAMVRMAEIDPTRLPGSDQRAGDTDPGGVIPAEFAGLSAMMIDRNTARVSVDGSDIVTVTLDVDDDFHINAHEPGDPALLGLLVHVVGGEGIVAHASYPQPEPYDMAGFENRIFVHHGRIQIRIRFERVGEVAGAPRLAIRWQPCTETACLKPQEHVFDLAFEIE